MVYFSGLVIYLRVYAFCMADWLMGPHRLWPIRLMRDRYIRSLCMTTKWDAKGGKSGATFSKTADERFVVKFITKTELQMFLDCALQ